MRTSSGSSRVGAVAASARPSSASSSRPELHRSQRSSAADAITRSRAATDTALSRGIQVSLAASPPLLHSPSDGDADPNKVVAGAGAGAGAVRRASDSTVAVVVPAGIKRKRHADPSEPTAERGQPPLHPSPYAPKPSEPFPAALRVPALVPAQPLVAYESDDADDD